MATICNIGTPRRQNVGKEADAYTERKRQHEAFSAMENKDDD
jgi:hypothetical protein